MTTKTTTTCDHCGKELTDAQHLVVTTRGSRIVGEKHLCDFTCMERWAPRAAKREQERMDLIISRFGKPGSPITWSE